MLKIIPAKGFGGVKILKEKREGGRDGERGQDDSGFYAVRFRACSIQRGSTDFDSRDG